MKKKFKALDQSLQDRILGGAMFGGVTLAALFIGGIVFDLLMLATAVIGIREWRDMIAKKKPLDRVQMAFGVLYIGTACIIMAWLRHAGLYHMLTLLFIIWASDVSAYFAGKTIGGPKLAPKISPKKTWAGFAGSSVGAGVVASLLATGWVQSAFGVHPLGQMGPFGYGSMGFMLAMFGQAGDLFISIFKRHYGIKDTGNLIRGHGGVLDRIDALLLVSLIFGMLAMIMK